MHVLQTGRCRAGGQLSSRVIVSQPSPGCNQARGSPARPHVHWHQPHQQAVSSKHQNADVVSSGAVQRQAGQNSSSKQDYEEGELHRYAWGSSPHSRVCGCIPMVALGPTSTVLCFFRYTLFGLGKLHSSTAAVGNLCCSLLTYDGRACENTDTAASPCEQHGCCGYGVYG
jgi:hypothetical protein